MKTDTWMPFYVGDYLGDTMDLSTEQHGAYMLLLLAYWRNRGPLSDDDEQFCRITRLMRDAWLTHRSRIALFFQIDRGMWRHKRVDAELEKAARYQESRVSAARIAASARWTKENHKEKPDASRMPDALRNAVPSPSPSPSDVQRLQKDVGENDSPQALARAAEAAPASRLSDADWLLSLEKDPAYSGIEVKREFAKMHRWCQANHKLPSRRRFVNWLNRCERPMNSTALHGSHAPHRQEKRSREYTHEIKPKEL